MIASTFEDVCSCVVTKAKKVGSSKFAADYSTNYSSTGLQDVISCVAD